MDNKEFVSVDPNKLQNQSEIEEDDNDDQDREYQWQRLFSHASLPWVFLTPHHRIQISHNQHVKEKRKEKQWGIMLPPWEKHIF